MSSLNPLVKVGKQISEIFTLMHGLGRSEARAKTIELMGAVGIPEPEKRFEQYPFHFSGGMRQRIVIAIALASNPQILICDEPTTALDVTIQAQVLGLIDSMQKERRLSTIFITHDLGVVAHIADRVAVMYAGKIVEYGTAEEVFYDPRHPYTWSLMSSMPDMDVEENEELAVIQGTPPNMLHPPEGDAFAERNPYALAIDFEREPPMMRITDTHYAATWLLHPKAPAMEMPRALVRRIEIGKARRKEAAHG
jgi:oligopeptide transport system ATP-binding protein